jgi:hypothetical protein
MQNRVRQRNHPDLLWVEPTYMNQGKRLSTKEAEEAGLKRKAPPQIRLEQVREIGEFLSRPPLEAGRSVVVLEQAETMGEGAANGLLKTLEEPGKANFNCSDRGSFAANFDFPLSKNPVFSADSPSNGTSFAASGIRGDFRSFRGHGDGSGKSWGGNCYLAATAINTR